MTANSDVDSLFHDAQRWRDEANALREILLGCSLSEEMKWGKPCYCHDGGNIAIIQRMKDFLALMFFKGAVLDDPEGILEKPGPNSYAGRRIQFTSVEDIVRRKAILKTYIRRAIEAENAGLETPQAPAPALPEELTQEFTRDSALKTAFNKLTPGRQRGYALYFSAPKQSKTRTARIEKHREKILSGKGLHAP